MLRDGRSPRDGRAGARTQPRMWWATMPWFWNVPHPLHEILGSPELKPLELWATTPQCWPFSMRNGGGHAQACVERSRREGVGVTSFRRETHSDENGWNSNTYAQSMACTSTTRRARTGGKGTGARSRSITANSVSEEGEVAELVAEERLKKNINAALGGLFGRLRSWS